MQSAAFLSATPLALSRRTILSSNLPVARRARPSANRIAKMSLADDLLSRAKEDTALLLRHSGKVLSVAALIAALSLPLDPTLAASGGGRVGGSSFRSPSMSRPAPPRMSAPSGGYGGGYGYSYGYGGGYSMPGLFLNPFIMPIGGFGFGGFGGILLFATAAAFLYESFSTRVQEKQIEDEVDPKTAVTVLKVGLLATARALQVDLDTLARSADTSTVSGLRYVLGETVTALLRNPDYWMYGSVDVKQARLSQAEEEFNRVSLEERLKLDEETLSNAAGRRVEAPRAAATRTDISKAPNEYIVVSLVVAAAGNLVTKLPKSIDSTNDVNRALRALAGVSKDSLQAVEVIWAPQSLRDTLSEREMLGDHPELRRL